MHVVVVEEQTTKKLNFKIHFFNWNLSSSLKSTYLDFYSKKIRISKVSKLVEKFAKIVSVRDIYHYQTDSKYEQKYHNYFSC